MYFLVIKKTIKIKLNKRLSSKKQWLIKITMKDRGKINSKNKPKLVNQLKKFKILQKMENKKYRNSTH